MFAVDDFHEFGVDSPGGLLRACPGREYVFGRFSKRSKLIKLLMLPYFLCATNYAGIAGLADFISGRRSVLWQQASRR